jgi:hypothetical protein
VGVLKGRKVCHKLNKKGRLISRTKRKFIQISLTFKRRGIKININGIPYTKTLLFYSYSNVLLSKQ